MLSETVLEAAAWPFGQSRVGEKQLFPKRGHRKLNSGNSLKLLYWSQDLKTKPCWSACVLFLLLTYAWGRMKLLFLSVRAGVQSKCWCGCMCAECRLIVRLWHQALHHVSIVLHFLDQIWDYLRKWFPRACVSTYSITHPYNNTCIYYKLL